MRKAMFVPVMMSMAFFAGAATPALAAPDPAPTPAARDAAGPDPAVGRVLGAIGTALALEFATRLATGGIDDFDPGPALEKSLRRLLDSRETQALFERLLDQVGGADPALSPALRAALRSAIGAARREMAREFGSP